MKFYIHLRNVMCSSWISNKLDLIDTFNYCEATYIPFMKHGLTVSIQQDKRIEMLYK